MPKTNTLPSPLFLTMMLVGLAAVSMAYEPIQPLAVGLLIIIIVGLLAMGYPTIHATFTSSGA